MAKKDVRLTVVTLGCRKNLKTVLAHECVKTKLKKTYKVLFQDENSRRIYRIIGMGWDGLRAMYWLVSILTAKYSAENHML